MNIKKAKEQIKKTVISYLEKDEYGNKLIPANKQRPVFLVGAPGIGKTDIMIQIARELNIGYVSYSLTHHTRQSALGLPVIVDKKYGNETYKVSEYTMSEIIASVYDVIEQSGNDQGILFIDEINCVSETLAPSMLQFLQYKSFGAHKVPENWVIVTAGNPPEYNDSVRPFDSVILDRLKKIDVSPEFNVWKEYAYNAKVHQAVISYLDSHQNNFYVVSKDVHGDSIVTARGWTDLSSILQVYEKKNFAIDVDLIIQYIQNQKIAREFFSYYELYMKYCEEFKIDDILMGNVNSEVISKAKAGSFDERIAIIGLILSSLTKYYANIKETEEYLKQLISIIKELNTVKTSWEEKLSNTISKLDYQNMNPAISKEDIIKNKKLIDTLEKVKNDLSKIDSTEVYDYIKSNINETLKEFNKEVSTNNNYLTHAFEFIDEAFDKAEMILFVTELSINAYTMYFISRFGNEEFKKQSKSIVVDSGKFEIDKELNLLD